MTKEKMTIHRGLSELKLIDSKIQKAITAIEPSGLMQAGKPVNGFYVKEDFEADAKSQYQSITDLINRKTKIKSAIVAVNGVTNVKIAGQTMTIADAISFKNTVGLKQQLIDTLFKKHNSVKARFLAENEKVNNVALENAKIMLGKQGDDKIKPTDADVKAIIEPFVKRNELVLVDPLDVEGLVVKLQQELDGFTSEVDAVLSEINAVTFIEF